MSCIFGVHRELAVKKDDFVDIVRRVDANWYEATKNGRVGIIPVTYVQVSICDMEVTRMYYLLFLVCKAM